MYVFGFAVVNFCGCRCFACVSFMCLVAFLQRKSTCSWSHAAIVRGDKARLAESLSHALGFVGIHLQFECLSFGGLI